MFPKQVHTQRNIWNGNRPGVWHDDNSAAATDWWDDHDRWNYKMKMIRKIKTSDETIRDAFSMAISFKSNSLLSAIYSCITSVNFKMISARIYKLEFLYKWSAYWNLYMICSSSCRILLTAPTSLKHRMLIPMGMFRRLAYLDNKPLCVC